MTTSPSSSFCRLDYRAVIFSTNIAAASRGDKISGPPVSDSVGSLFKPFRRGSLVALLFFLVAEPTGVELGMPKESSAAPGPSTIQYDVRHLPEDQVGAAKDAMVQVESMAGDAKGAYDSIASLYKRSLELRDSIRKTCEMGSAYNALKAENI
ncbi:hypothetical protein ZWY2020_052485 [Hordeum vulgare]|nr:hypothetical protein ZWY2020_052485 [Hordeum vulgare]